MSETDDSTSTPSLDYRLWGYLVCMLVIALTVVTGFEFRTLLETREIAVAVILVIAYSAAVLLIAYLQIRASLTRVVLKIGGRKVKVAPVDAPAEIAQRIRTRAAELGFGGELDVCYLPRTWNVTDAYVSGVGRHQSLVLTGGLMKQSFSHDEDERAQFDFVIDHEIGHIRHGDTSVLYMARAILIAAIAFVPIKLVFLVYAGTKMLNLYATIFPRIFSQQDWAFYDWEQRGLNWTLSPTTVAVTIGIFLCLTIAALSSIYVILVRRREFLADQFAIANSNDPAMAKEALKQLLSSAGLSSAPPQSFQGNIRWHPSSRERIQAIGRAVVSTLNEGMLAGLLLVLLLSYRFAFGTSTMPTVDVPSGVLEPLSGLLILLFGFVIQALLTKAPNTGSSADRLSVPAILAWSAGITVLCIIVVVVLQPIPDEIISRGQEPLMRLERADWIMLLGSAPMVLAAFCFSQFAVNTYAFKGAPSLEATLGRSVVVSLLSLVLLGALSLAVSPLVTAYRESAFQEYTSGRKTRIAAEQSAGMSEPSMKGEDLTGRYPGLTAPAGFTTDPDELIARHNMMLQFIEIARGRLDHSISPPLSFLLLWQGAFRSTAL